MQLSVVSGVTFLLVVLSVSVSDVTGITCYLCDSNTTDSCGEKFVPDGIPTCTGTACTKQYSGVSGWSPEITRGCSSETSEYCNTLNVGYMFSQCACLKDKCNTAAQVRSGIQLWISMILAFIGLFAAIA